MPSIRLAICQINPVVGDLGNNVKKIIEYIERAKESEADLALFPELAVTGYPPEDLLLRSDFCIATEKALKKVVKATEGILAVVGFVRRDGNIYNSAALSGGGKAHAFYDKICLPNYGVFDEHRYFAAGSKPLVFEYGGVLFGVTICEDIWFPDGPHIAEVADGARVVLNLSASPYHYGKWEERETMISARASDAGAHIAYCNLTGGQDELLFDGGSLFVDKSGKITGRLPLFDEALSLIDIDTGEGEKLRGRGGNSEFVMIPPCGKRKKRLESAGSSIARRPPIEEEIFRALVRGTRDYVRKNGFEKVVVGLSGGIDSSLVASIAVEALGGENLIGVSMPSLVTSSESIEDARELANNLGISFTVIPILDIFEGFKKSLKDTFEGREEDVTEENLQARIRGMILMAISNKFSFLVLTTGNKSEMSVGYATLYGDMAGGYGVIKDVYKTMVYRLARFYNGWKGSEIIPERVIIKEPSAELKPGQKDADSLPPYEILDPILEAYVEEDSSLEDIVGMGFPNEVVKRVISMVDGNEYKRRQAPPGMRITQRGLGKDRRMPITNRFKG